MEKIIHPQTFLHALRMTVRLTLCKLNRAPNGKKHKVLASRKSDRIQGSIWDSCHVTLPAPQPQTRANKRIHTHTRTIQFVRGFLAMCTGCMQTCNNLSTARTERHGSATAGALGCKASAATIAIGARFQATHTNKFL